MEKPLARLNEVLCVFEQRLVEKYVVENTNFFAEADVKRCLTSCKIRRPQTSLLMPRTWDAGRLQTVGEKRGKRKRVAESRFLERGRQWYVGVGEDTHRALTVECGRRLGGGQ